MIRVSVLYASEAGKKFDRDYMEQMVEDHASERRVTHRTQARRDLPVDLTVGLGMRELIGHVQRNMDDLRGRCENLLLEHSLVGDLRGDGFFYSLELVKDKETKETFTPAERDELIKGFLVPRTRELGVYMRFDDRGETCAQFAPPLVAGPAEFEEMVGVLRQVLDETRDRINTKVGA